MIARTRRNTELVLIVLAGLITCFAYVLGTLGRTSDIPANILPFLGVVLGLALLAHLAVRFLAPAADPLLLPLATLLNGIGYVFIARVDERLAGLQATWVFVAVGGFVGTLLVVRRTASLARYPWTFAFVALALLVLPFLPGVGQVINGSRIWVSFGPVNFQPGEFAKVALALFFAAYLDDRRELLSMATWKVGPLWLPEPRALAPVVVAWLGSLAIMIFQKDLGSSLLFFALFVVMLWVATERLTYLVMGGLLFAGGAWVTYQQFAHVQDRVTIWLDPWSEASGRGYQIVQAAFALAWGGVVGTGIGLGDPTRIPEVENDFIFAAIGEELGLFGATAIIIAFLLMIGSGLRIAARAQRSFDKLLAVGLTTILGLQAFIIIGGVIRLVPLTGVTLPFVSYGGSSLVANYLLLALLLRISDSTARRAGEYQSRRERKAAAATADDPALAEGAA